MVANNLSVVQWARSLALVSRDCRGVLPAKFDFDMEKIDLQLLDPVRTQACDTFICTLFSKKTV